MNLENIYLHLPYWLQYLILNFKGYLIAKNRFDNDFHVALTNYHKNNRSSVDIEKLKSFMFSARKAPFWKERFKKYKVNLDSVDILKEIQKLPVLTKDEVKEHLCAIKVADLKEPVSNVKTSGTTGSGMKFPITRSMEAHQWAVWWRFRNNHGIDFTDLCAWFGGKSILNIERKSSPFWIHNHPMNQIMFSAYHLNNSTVALYFNKIKTKRVTWIHGYPSQISYFASLVEKSNLGILPNLKIITFGAENLLLNQISLIKRVFGDVKLAQHYGMAEGVANISEDSEGKLVADQDFALTEFVKSKQTNSYKIVGTGYSNLAFPLIRYFTGDYASISLKDNRISIDAIDGRNEDYITLSNGVKLGRLDHVFKSVGHIVEAQIHQYAIDKITIRIVKTSTYSDRDEINLTDELNKRFGKNMIVNLEYCEKIKRTASGKFKFVISEV